MLTTTSGHQSEALCAAPGSRTTSVLGSRASARSKQIRGQPLKSRTMVLGIHENPHLACPHHPLTERRNGHPSRLAQAPSDHQLLSSRKLVGTRDGPGTTCFPLLTSVGQLMRGHLTSFHVRAISRMKVKEEEGRCHPRAAYFGLIALVVACFFTAIGLSAVRLAKPPP
jgi:hypothetical protein